MTGEEGYEASVIKKLGQSAHRILCVLRDNTRGPARLVPVDRRARHELVPARGETSKAEDGDLVVDVLVPHQAGTKGHGDGSKTQNYP